MFEENIKCNKTSQTQNWHFQDKSWTNTTSKNKSNGLATSRKRLLPGLRNKNTVGLKETEKGRKF